MNKKRLKSTRKYYHAIDSYARSKTLTETRRESCKVFGLPLSLKLNAHIESTIEDISLVEHLNDLNKLSLFDVNILKRFLSKVKASNNALTLNDDESVNNFLEESGHSSKHDDKNESSLTIQETFQSDKRYLFTQLRTYNVSSGAGDEFELLQLFIPHKIPILEKSLQDFRKCHAKQNLKSTIVSERSASLIIISGKASTILLASDRGSSLYERYNKFISDLTLTSAKVKEEAHVWDATIGTRIKYAAKYCHHQQNQLKKLEALPYLFPVKENSFLTFFLSIKNKLHIVRSIDVVAKRKAIWQMQNQPILALMDDIFEKWEGIFSKIRLSSRHHRVAPTIIVSAELRQPKSYTLAQIFSSPSLPHGLENMT